MPFALKKEVEEELKRLQSTGLIEKTEHADWGTPIVPVMKKNGEIRLCADHKSTINGYTKADNYPIPKIEDIFTQMNGGRFFCSLDLNKAYLHMKVDEASARLQTISTHVQSKKTNVRS